MLEQSSAQKQNLNLHRVFEREKIDLWFVNLTDIQVPDSVQDILRLGKGFGSNMMNDKLKQISETRFCTYPRVQLRNKVCILLVWIENLLIT